MGSHRGRFCTVTQTATWGPARVQVGAIPKFVPPNGMGAGCPLLGPANRQRRVIEVDLVPTQVDKFRRSQAVPVGQQHHGGIAVAVSVGLGGLRQALDLGIGQILPGPQLSVRSAQWRRNCSIYSSWRYQVEMGTLPWFSALLPKRLFE